MKVAVVTGASLGLGRALASGLVLGGWSLVIDGRNPDALEAAAAQLRAMAPGAEVVAVAGDVTDAAHRRALVAAAQALGGLDLLVSNAGILGPSPLPPLAAFPLDGLRDLFEVYAVAGLGLIQVALPLLRLAAGGGRIVLVSSDAAVEGYPGWGGYGAAKAALDQLARVLTAEEPDLHIWAVDPGDLRTRMHQQAFPGEDISDRARPESVVPALLELVASERPSGRLRAADLALSGGAG